MKNRLKTFRKKEKKIPFRMNHLEYFEFRKKLKKLRLIFDIGLSYLLIKKRSGFFTAKNCKYIEQDSHCQ